jgi:sodium/hydrogen antiporter
LTAPPAAAADTGFTFADPLAVGLVFIGFAVFAAVGALSHQRERAFSASLIYLGLGIAAATMIELLDVRWIDPFDDATLIEHLAEFAVIVALFGTGLKLERALEPGAWPSVTRLLVIAMPLTIAAVTLFGTTVMGLSLGAAIMLGAILAPTDPVLAGDVGVGPPGDEDEHDPNFALTAEAGLNDGLAFPFVNLAIAIAAAGTLAPQDWAAHWFGVDVIWKLAAGVGVGWAVGRLLGWLTFRIPNRARLSRTGDGFVALGVTCLAYGLTEMAHGYGFLAVFVAALSLRAAERNHDYHERLHDFAEQLERLLMMVLLVIFGASITGGLFAPLDWKALVFAAVTLLLIRPLTGWIGLLGLPHPADERAVMAFYGIRGLGSAYYLAYAYNREAFAQAEYVWAVLGLVVLVSIVMHGTTVTPVMRRLDHRRKRKERRRRGDAASGRERRPESLPELAGAEAPRSGAAT